MSIKESVVKHGKQVVHHHTHHHVHHHNCCCGAAAGAGTGATTLAVDAEAQVIAWSNDMAALFDSLASVVGFPSGPGNSAQMDEGTIGIQDFPHTLGSLDAIGEVHVSTIPDGMNQPYYLEVSILRLPGSYLDPTQAVEFTQTDANLDGLTATELTNYKNEPGSDVYRRADFQYKYKQLPTQAQVNAMQAPTAGATGMEYSVLTGPGGGSLVETGRMYRELRQVPNVEGVAEHWVLRDTFTPVNATTIMRVVPLGPAAAPGPKAFLAAQIAARQAAGSPVWRYAFDEYTQTVL